MEIEGSRVDLANRIVELEAQCEWLKEDKIKLKEQVMKAKGEEERMKGKYMKGKGEYLEMKEKFGLEKIKWREEDEKIWGKYWQLEEANRMLQFDVKENASSINGGDEASVKLRATEAEVERLKSSLEERDGRITKLLEKIGALDKQCNTLETDFKANMVMEAKKTKLEEEKNLELIRKLQVLEREKEQMVAEASKLRKEKSDSAKKALEAEIKRLKKALEWVEKAMQDGVSNLKREKSEEVSKILKEKMAAESEKRDFEEDVNKLIAASMKKIVYLEKENKEMEAKLSRANMEKDVEIKKILNEQITLKEEGQKMVLERDETIEVLRQKNKTLEAQNKQLEVERSILILKRKEDEKNSEMNKKFQVLEREKEEMVAEFSKLEKERSDEAGRSFSAKKALEAEKKRLDEVEVKNVELVKRIGLLERVEKAMQDGISNLKREKSEEVSLKKIVALEKENNEMKAKLSRANMEKDAEIKRILNEKITLKEEGQKMITERDEAIKILYQENQTLEAQNKQLEMENIRLVLKREEDVDSAHQSHSVSNVVGFLATPPAQNIQGIIKIEEQTTLASS